MQQHTASSLRHALRRSDRCRIGVTVGGRPPLPRRDGEEAASCLTPLPDGLIPRGVST